MYHLSIKHVYKKFKNEAVLEDVNLEFSGCSSSSDQESGSFCKGSRRQSNKDYYSVRDSGHGRTCKISGRSSSRCKRKVRIVTWAATRQPCF